MALAFPSSVKFINVSNRPERIFASDIKTKQMIEVTPELLEAIERVEVPLDNVGLVRYDEL